MFSSLRSAICHQSFIIQRTSTRFTHSILLFRGFTTGNSQSNAVEHKTMKFSPFESINNVLGSEFPEAKLEQLQTVYKLSEQEGCTLPFIARYRQEQTGGLGPDELRPMLHALRQLVKLCERKDFVYDHISKALTKPADKPKLSSIKQSLRNAKTIHDVDAIYQPFKPSATTTLADRARKHGLEPLAQSVWAGKIRSMGQLNEALNPIVHASQKFPDKEDRLTRSSAVDGVGHLLSESIAQDSSLRLRLRDHMTKFGHVQCQYAKSSSSKPKSSKSNPKTSSLQKHQKSTKVSKETFSFYENFDMPFRRIQSHHILAIKRGEAHKLLKSKIVYGNPSQSEPVVLRMIRSVVPHASRQKELSGLIDDACKDAWKRLLLPATTRGIFHELVEKAHKESAQVFARNLEGLLLSPAHLHTPVVGVDPGFSHGCKLAVLGTQGEVLDTSVIFPHTRGAKGVEQARNTVLNVIKKFKTTHVVVGNGTANRETVQFIQSATKDLRVGDSSKETVQVHTISEAGASVYSASKVAKEEFPKYNVELLGAVSIGRRWQDPLSELVKVEPQSLGVGMYQHDLPVKVLDEHLTETVVECVSRVGVDVNMASIHLLQRIAGLTKTIAGKIFNESRKSPFLSRDAIRSRVSGLGPKRFEQCAGFLTVSPATASNLLDSTRVHPESYNVAEALWKLARKVTRKAGEKDQAKRFKVSKAGLKFLQGLCLGDPSPLESEKQIDRDLLQVASFLIEAIQEDLGLEIEATTSKSTSYDINQRKRKLGVESEQNEEKYSTVSSIEQLKSGMLLHGVVTNVAPFGAFIDVGISKSGLLHCSKYSIPPIVGQTMPVVVENVDVKRGRISLATKDSNTASTKTQSRGAKRQK